MPSSKSSLVAILLLSALVAAPSRAADEPATDASANAADPFAEEAGAAPKVLTPTAVHPTPDGRRLYLSHCAACHGAAGDGRGAVAGELTTAPAAFTLGLYKFRSTPTSTLPTDADLLATVTRGIPRTNMPGWGEILTEPERVAVVGYLKSLYPGFAQEGAGQPIVIGEPPATTPELLEKGREQYKKMECAKCHGETGRGDGASSATLKDALGRKSKAYDFTGGGYHGGSAPKDIYRTFNTGMDGTPMPSYFAAMTEEERWALVAYVKSLEEPTGALWGYLFPSRARWE